MSGRAPATPRAVERLDEAWEHVRPALRRGSVLFEMAMTGHVAIYCGIFLLYPDYWNRLGSLLADRVPSMSTYYVEVFLLTVGTVALTLTAVSTARHAFYGPTPTLKWRRAATLARAVFFAFLGTTQILVSPQWPGPALVSFLCFLCSVLAEVGQEIEARDRSTGGF